jgi:hypothetical protein
VKPYDHKSLLAVTADAPVNWTPYQRDFLAMLAARRERFAALALAKFAIEPRPDDEDAEVEWWSRVWLLAGELELDPHTEVSEEEFRAKWRAVKRRKKDQAKLRPSPVHVAMAVLTHNPDLTDAKIAAQAGCAPSTLSRSREYQALRKTFRQELPRGLIDSRNGELDAEK